MFLAVFEVKRLNFAKLSHFLQITLRIFKKSLRKEIKFDAFPQSNFLSYIIATRAGFLFYLSRFSLEYRFLQP